MEGFKVTKEIMEEYEVIRQSGASNMFDYYNVVSIAKKVGCNALGGVTVDQYKHILLNFNKYMRKFKVKQPSINL